MVICFKLLNGAGFWNFGNSVGLRNVYHHIDDGSS